MWIQIDTDPKHGTEVSFCAFETPKKLLHIDTIDTVSVNIVNIHYTVPAFQLLTSTLVNLYRYLG